MKEVIVNEENREWGCLSEEKQKEILACPRIMIETEDGKWMESRSKSKFPWMIYRGIRYE